MDFPDLGQDDVLVFVSQDLGYNDYERTSHYLSKISDEEQQQYRKFYFDKDRRLYLLSHALLRMCLAHYCGCSEHELTFGKNKYGKPYLLNDVQLKFNLSHSKKATAIAIHKNHNLSLGIDIECFNKSEDIIDLAFHYFSESECTMLKQYPAEQQLHVFFKLWSLKESYIKAIGKGLSIDLDSFSFSSLEKDIAIDHCNGDEQLKYWRFFQSPIYQEYMLALAIRCEKNIVQDMNVHTYEYLSNHSLVSKNIKYCF